jgi:4-amino-4-deoxy-L-arabinose transferase-like glycosyltransferase
MKVSGTWSLLLAVVVASWFFLWNLGQSSISLRSDEIIYTRVTQSILHKGALFPLQHGNVPTYEKPPLKLWLGSIAPLIAGESNLSFRIFDGVLGVITVALTICLARALTGAPVVALLSGLALLGMPELVISHHGFRRGVLDGLLTALTVLSCWFTWGLIQKKNAGCALRDLSRSALLVGIVCSLGVLTKSVAGFVPAACAFASFVLLTPRSGVKDYARIFLGIVGVPVFTFLAYVFALWFVAGIKGISVFIGVEIFTRTISGFEGHNTDQRWFYLWSLFVRGSTVPRNLLIVGLIGAVLTARVDKASRFILIWALLPVGLYSLSASKVPWYINPFLPFISIMALWGAKQILDLLHSRWPGKKVYVLGLTLLCAVTLPAYSRAIIRHAKVVLGETQRIELDLLVSELVGRYTAFVILEDSLSGRTSPIKGRFNLEGIYREMLRPRIEAFNGIAEYHPKTGDVVFVKEGSLSSLEPGWKMLRTLEPFGARSWRLAVVEY